MDTMEQQANACLEHLDRFLQSYRDDALATKAVKVLRFLVASDISLEGKPAGWAAGIIYALVNRDRRACGVPGILNADFEQFFCVSMSTVRKRAAQVQRMLDI